MLFCLCLKSVHHVAPCEPHSYYMSSAMEGLVFLPWHEMGMEGNCPASAAGREPMAMGAMPTVEAHLALFVLCARNALFHPVLDCTVFFLVTLKSGCNGHECSEPFSGISNQCVVICSHIHHPEISRTSC